MTQNPAQPDRVLPVPPPATPQTPVQGSGQALPGAGAATRSIYIFYGFSGSQAGAPSFPDGTDADKSFQLVAETLAESLRKIYPTYQVYTRQAWTKEKILETLESAREPIDQVHIACHGDSTRLSLSYEFGGGSRLEDRARRFNSMSGSDLERAAAAMLDEDAIVAGLFSLALDRSRLDRIKTKHVSGASWQIWGCYGGYETVTFQGVGDPELDAYFQRFNVGSAEVSGIAVEIAMSFGVVCTAAKGAGGLEFWHGESGQRVVRNSTQTPARKPFWLWNTTGSTWVSYDRTGARLPRPEMFHIPRDSSDLPTPQPPTWLTDLFWQ